MIIETEELREYMDEKLIKSLVKDCFKSIESIGIIIEYLDNWKPRKYTQDFKDKEKTMHILKSNVEFLVGALEAVRRKVGADAPMSYYELFDKRMGVK